MNVTIGGDRRQSRSPGPRLFRIVTAALAAVVVTPVAAAALSESGVSAAPTPTCSVDSGVSVLWNWSMGAPPPIQTPGSDWRQSVHPNPMLNFFVPGDWVTNVLPVPDWLAGSWQAYDWSGVRVASPDGTTGIEIASAPIAGVYDTSAALTFALDGMFGEVQPNVLCTGYSPATGSSLIVAESGGTLVYIAGYAFPDATLGQTALVYYAAFAPTEIFAASTQTRVHHDLLPVLPQWRHRLE